MKIKIKNKIMTAVEWYKERLKFRFINGDIEESIYNKAKEMEKQQKIDFAKAFYDSLFQDAESYHNYLESKK